MCFEYFRLSKAWQFLEFLNVLRNKHTIHFEHFRVITT